MMAYVILDLDEGHMKVSLILDMKLLRPVIVLFWVNVGAWWFIAVFGYDSIILLAFLLLVKICFRLCRCLYVCMGS